MDWSALDIFMFIVLRFLIDLLWGGVGRVFSSSLTRTLGLLREGRT